MPWEQTNFVWGHSWVQGSNQAQEKKNKTKQNKNYNNNNNKKQQQQQLFHLKLLKLQILLAALNFSVCLKSWRVIFSLVSRKARIQYTFTSCPFPQIINFE